MTKDELLAFGDEPFSFEWKGKFNRFPVTFIARLLGPCPFSTCHVLILHVSAPNYFGPFKRTRVRTIVMEINHDGLYDETFEIAEMENAKRCPAHLLKLLK